MQTRRVTQRRSSFGGAACLLVLFCTACSDPGSDSVVLTADLPLHLEDHLDVATIEGSEVPADLPELMEWRFDDPWKPVGYAESQPVRLTRLDDALRVDITEANYYTSNTGQRVHEWVYLAISEFPKWRKHLILLSFRVQSSVRPVQVDGSDVNRDSYSPVDCSPKTRRSSSTSCMARSLRTILSQTDGPYGS